MEKFWKQGIALILSVLCSQTALAFDEEEGLNYDAILQKLSRPESMAASSRSMLDEVKIHGGVGLTNALYGIKHPNGDSTYAAQRGVEVSLGIDLFSKFWIAEGAFRNYGQQKFENATLDLKEFDLKVVHRNQLSSLWGYRLGAGIVARYLQVSYQGPGLKYGEDYQTPHSVVQGGVETFLTRRWSLGADLAWKSALIDESPDRTGYDVTLRIAGHF